MTIDEVRLRLRRKLEEAFGVDEADLLLDRPPGGWGDLVTSRGLERAFDTFRAEIRGEVADLRVELHRGFQEQTRFLAMFVVASQGVVVAAVAVICAALRFA